MFFLPLNFEVNKFFFLSLKNVAMREIFLEDVKLYSFSGRCGKSAVITLKYMTVFTSSI